MSGGGRTCTSPVAPSTMMASPGSTRPVALSISPTAAMPSARATIATCECRAALLQHEAAQALAVVVEQRRRPHRAGDQDGVLRQAARATARGPGR